MLQTLSEEIRGFKSTGDDQRLCPHRPELQDLRVDWILFLWNLKMTVLSNNLVIAGGPTWFSVPVRLIRDEPSLAPTVMLGENRELDSEGKDKHLQGRREFF